MHDFDIALQEIIEERVSVLFEIERAIFTKRYSLSSIHKDIWVVLLCKGWRIIPLCPVF